MRLDIRNNKNEGGKVGGARGRRQAGTGVTCIKCVLRAQRMRSVMTRRCSAAAVLISTSNSTTVSAPRMVTPPRPTPMAASSSASGPVGITGAPASSTPHVHAMATCRRASRLNMSTVACCSTPTPGLAPPAAACAANGPLGGGASSRMCRTRMASRNWCSMFAAAGSDVSTSKRWPPACTSRTILASTPSLPDEPCMDARLGGAAARQRVRLCHIAC